MLCRIPPTKRSHQPQHHPRHQRRQQQLRMMQKMQGFIPQKDDDRPIAMRDKIECVGEESRDGIMARQDRHENKLDNVEEDVDGKEGANTHVEAVAEFQHIATSRWSTSDGRRRWWRRGRGEEALLTAAAATAREDTGNPTAGCEEAAHQEIGQRGVYEGGAEKVDEDEHQGKFGDGGGGGGVGEGPGERGEEEEE